MMNQRRISPGAAAGHSAEPENPNHLDAESGMRIRRVGASRLVDDDVDAAIDCAMNELDALEVPYTASAPPLAAEPAQQMPRGMPPLPFVAPHPRNMPPLPAKLKAVSLVPRRSSPIMDEAAADG